MKDFSVKDGCGIHDILIPSGIIPIIITGRNSDIVELRCKEIGIIRCYGLVGTGGNFLSVLIEKIGKERYNIHRNRCILYNGEYPNGKLQ